jgi:hypothetical protein
MLGDGKYATTQIAFTGDASHAPEGGHKPTKGIPDITGKDGPTRNA